MRYKATISVNGSIHQELDLEVDDLARALRALAVHAQPLSLEDEAGHSPEVVARLQPRDAVKPARRDPRDG